MVSEKIINIIKSDPNKYGNNAKIEDLENTLRELSNAYYNTGVSLVEDDIFDILKEILEERDPKNKFLKEIGSPIVKKKVKLPYPMGSLDKIKPDSSELKKWTEKYKGPYVLSDKLDGVSAQLFKDDNGNIKLYSRGNGTEGQDITHLIKYVIKKKVNLKEIPNGTSIRGEIIISKKNFKIIENEMANARNAVAGLINSKKIDQKLAKISEFIAYSIIYPLYKQTEQMTKMEKWNFDVVKYKVETKLTNELLNEYLIDRRKNGNYEVDGIVVVDSMKGYKVEQGNPDHSFAYKMLLNDQVAEATVIDVLWEVSKYGYLKPRIQISPIHLGGTKITYATAHNGSYVYNNKLGPGAKIKISRSGDVIPYILEIIKPAKVAKMPNVPYVWTESGVDIIIKNKNEGNYGDTIKMKIIVNFFKILGVKNIDEGLVAKLIDNGYDSIFKILKANREKLEEIEGVGKKLVIKVYESIEYQLGHTDLATLMAASNIFGNGMGVKKIKMVTDVYPDIMDKKWDENKMVEKLNEIKGFSDISSNKFAENFGTFKKFFNDLNKIINIEYLKNIEEEDEEEKGTQFDGEIVVFTGFRNKEWEKLIEDNGGKISSGVSGKTTLVVYSGPDNSSKLIKAKELKIKILSDKEFEKIYIN